MSTKKGSTHSTKQFFVLFFVVAAIGGGAFAFAYAELPDLLAVSYTGAKVAEFVEEKQTPEKPQVAHLPTPVPLKAIYMSQCVVGTPLFRDSLVDFVENSALNAIVIDIKDFTGKIAFPTNNPVLKDSVSPACGATDMRQFIERLHEKNIYVIGRITVFQDPHYTSLYPEQAVQKTGGGVWKDYKGLAFVDVGARPFWDYIVELAKESYALGFDELNFDYIRFPSDGPMLDAEYTHSTEKNKEQALEEFFAYLHEKLTGTGAILSADLFGMTASAMSDLGIGQVLERTLPYFDYISPMTYPSHYPSGFQGFAQVNDHAYEIIKYEMDAAVARTVATTSTVASMAYTPLVKEVVVPATVDSTGSPQATTTKQVATGLYQKPSYDKNKIRPWFQSFDYPVMYTPQMVADQIRANEEVGLHSWLFWDAANQYTALRMVLASSTLNQ